MGTVLATFVDSAMKGLPIVIQGDGSQWRSFIYVEDLALGNVAALQDAAKNQTFNLDGSERVTVRQIADKVLEAFPGADVRYVESRAGDTKSKAVASRKAKELLGWAPTVSFQEGADSYIRWAKEAAASRKAAV
jgi:nucleoside-diphosphate-sugar epimerase